MYIKCGAISSAIRVAAEASAWNLVWRAGSTSPTHALHAASILESAAQNEQAIFLYQKAGKLAGACDVLTHDMFIYWSSEQSELGPQINSYLISAVCL